MNFSSHSRFSIMRQRDAMPEDPNVHGEIQDCPVCGDPYDADEGCTTCARERAEDYEDRDDHEEDDAQRDQGGAA